MYAAGQQVKNCCPTPTGYVLHKINKMTVQVYKLYTIFQVCFKIKNVKEKKNTQQDTEKNLLIPFQ
jgi:hypothetical protein